jgi:NADPH2:quinone reductase
MKAIAISQPGGPEVLQLVEREQPTPAIGEVLVRVKAAGINRPDVTQRKGNYPPPPGVPADIPGLEIAGTIAEVGRDCKRWKEGDSVCALVAGGGYAEYAVVPEGQCLPLPHGIDFSGAASLPETFFTVWTNVFDRVALQPGESILVQGGAGGIGVAAIQMCKAWRCKVYATAGSPEKAEFCRQLGADVVIDYNLQSFQDVIMKDTNGKGVNVVLDMIGGAYTPLHLDILATEGRLSIINYMKGDEATIRHAPILRKRLTITGSTLRARDAQFKAAIARNLERTVWPWIAQGIVRPVVTETFSLADAGQAHRRLESGTHTGKIVLTV